MSRKSKGSEANAKAITSVNEKGLNLKVFLGMLGENFGKEVPQESISRFFRFSKLNMMTNRDVGIYLSNLQSKSQNQLRKLKWHSNDKFIFVWVIYKYCELKRIPNFNMDFDDWIQVGSILENDHEFLKRKWAAMVRHTTCLLKWSDEEEELLSILMGNKDYEYKWTDLSIKIHESLGRHILRGCKDVRERWYNYLNPTLKKGKWTEEQDILLRQLAHSEGRKWSAIARRMEGRTQNQVKNRLNSMLKRKLISEEIFGEGCSNSQTEAIHAQSQEQNVQHPSGQVNMSPLIEKNYQEQDPLLEEFLNRTDEYSPLNFNFL